MRALDTIAQSIRLGHAHPTNILNTLIEVENEAGLSGVRRIERHLHLGTAALREREHPHAATAQMWLSSARAYLITQAERKQAV